MHKTKRTNKYLKKLKTENLKTKKLKTKKLRHVKTMKNYFCKKGMTDEAKRYLKYIHFFKNNKQISLSNDP
jgi:elongation factor P--beta-lysine ligase